jgi:hypothetical protein
VGTTIECCGHFRIAEDVKTRAFTKCVNDGGYTKGLATRGHPPWIFGMSICITARGMIPGLCKVLHINGNSRVTTPGFDS